MTFIMRLLTELGIENVQDICLPVLTKVAEFAEDDAELTKNKLNH